MRRAQKGRLSLGQKGEEGGEGSPVPIISETLPGSENLPVIGLVDVALAPHLSPLPEAGRGGSDCTDTTRSRDRR